MPYAGPYPNHPLKIPAELVTSDVTVYDPPIVAVRIGAITGGSTLRAVNLNSVTVNFAGCGVGEMVWGPFIQVMAAGTTASSLVGYKNE